VHLPNYPHYSFLVSFSCELSLFSAFLFPCLLYILNNRKLHSPSNQKSSSSSFPRLSLETHVNESTEAGLPSTHRSRSNPSRIPAHAHEPRNRDPLRALIPASPDSPAPWFRLRPHLGKPCFAAAFPALPGFGSDLICCSLSVPLVEENLFFGFSSCWTALFIAIFVGLGFVPCLGFRLSPDYFFFLLLLKLLCYDCDWCQKRGKGTLLHLALAILVFVETSARGAYMQFF